MTRATLGHTGREVTASTTTVAIYGAMILATLLRINAGFVPDAYGIMLEIAGAAWIAAFAIFLFEYGPMLLRVRR
jgi:uncharacterized protein involved in response to NO